MSLVNISKLLLAAGGRIESPELANKHAVILTRVSCLVLLCVLLFHSAMFVEVSWNWVFLQISMATAVTICAMQVTVGIMFANWYVGFLFKSFITHITLVDFISLWAGCVFLPIGMFEFGLLFRCFY